MVTLVTVFHVITCLFLILVILLQAGKGGGMGAAFGGASTQAVFGGRGAVTFLTKMTTVMAVSFIITSICLAWFASQTEDRRLKARAAATQKKDNANPLAPMGGAAPTAPAAPTSQPAQPAQPAAEKAAAPAPAEKAAAPAPAEKAAAPAAAEKVAAPAAAKRVKKAAAPAASDEPAAAPTEPAAE